MIVSLEVMKQQEQALISGPTLPKISLWLVLVVVLTMPLYPFLTTWIGSLVGQPQILKAAKDVLLGLMAIGLLVWLLLDSGRRQQISRDSVLWLMLGVVALSFFVTLWANPPFDDPLLAGILANGRYLAIFFLVYASLRYGDAKLNFSSKVLPVLGWLGVGLAAVGILQVFVLPLDTLEHFGYDKDTTIAPYTLIDDNPDAPRAFATLRGPNDYAAYLVMPVLAATLLTRYNRKWLIAVGLIVFALVLSSSRSAWLGLVVALFVIMLVFYAAATDRAKRWMRIGSYVAVIVGSITLMAATTVPALRLAIFHSSPDDTHLTEGSTDEHWIATSRGIDRVLDQPMGCGVGCAGPASFYSDTPNIAENYFIQVAEEIGVLGLLAWLSMFVAVMYRLWQKRSSDIALMVFAAGIGLSVVGVWLHVWYDDPVSLTWWALAGLALALTSISIKKPLK